MPKYRVIVTRDTTESITVEVEAAGEEEAQSKALDASYSGNYFGQWEQDDTANASSDHYTNGAEVLEPSKD